MSQPLRPAVSVVVPCLNAEATLGRQLGALVSQDFDEPFEIIVADNGSSDLSVNIVRRHAAVAPAHIAIRVVEAFERQGVNHARNAGTRASNAELILLCDADDIVAPRWVREMVRAYRDGNACLGGGLDRRLPDDTLVARDGGLYEDPWPAMPRPLGANCGFTRAAFDAVSGFDEEFRGGADEADFFWRAAWAGYPIRAVPDARITYFERTSLRALARQYYSRGLMQPRLYRKHRNAGMPRKRLSQALPRALVGLVEVLVGGRRSKRRGVRRVASFVGRLRGSARERLIYL